MPEPRNRLQKRMDLGRRLNLVWYNLVLGHSEVACILNRHLSVESSY